MSAEIMRVSTRDGKLRYRAYAKVNLALAVGGRRDDGYHDISTVMVPVRVFDLISVGVRPGPSAGEPGPDAFPPFSEDSFSIRLSCPGLPDVPAGRNLAYIAAACFLEKAGVRLDVSISVKKRIPWGAGMGGGSSDAAAVLAAMNRLVPPERALGVGDLLSLAASIGADVPFFIGCNSKPPLWEGALCTGIGEKVVPVDVPNMWLVIAVSNVPVQTGKVYALLDDMRQSKGRGLPAPPQDFKSSAVVTRKPDVGSLGPGGPVLGADQSRFPFQDDRVAGLVERLASGDIEEIGRRLFNDLEEPAISLQSGIGRLKRMFCECGALGVSMTGSGSAVFGIAGSESEARELAVKLRRMAVGSGLEVGDIIVARTGVDRDGC